MKNCILLILTLLALSACKSDYEKMVARESAKEGRQDSIFLGITSGMTAKEFYGHCWQLNKEGIQNKEKCMSSKIKIVEYQS